MDVAKSMEPLRPAVEASTPSLVDFAKKQQTAGNTSGSGAETKKPVTLMDVARQESVSESANARAPTKSLQSIAQEINDEDNKRIEKALTATASEVRREQRERQANLLKEAVAEVRQEETRAALNIVAKIENKSSLESSGAPTGKPNFSQEQGNNNAVPRHDDKDNEDDGYSSFGDQDEEQELEKKVASKLKKKAKVKILSDDENDLDDDNNNGPERTITSDTPESKAFLRAVYRADLRTIQDMMDSEDASTTTADQVRIPCFNKFII